MSLVSDILTPVREEISDKDSAAYRWSDDTLISHLNDGIKELVKIRPDAYALRTVVTLTPGAVLHTTQFPAGGTRLIAVTHNMGVDGATPGEEITFVEREKLAEYDRTWRTMTGETVIYHWSIDRSKPREFYTWPKAHAVTRVDVELLYGAYPAAMAAVGDTMLTDTVYDQSLQYYVQARALMKDDPSSDFPRGMGWMNVFYQSIGMPGIPGAGDPRDGNPEEKRG